MGEGRGCWSGAWREIFPGKHRRQGEWLAHLERFVSSFPQYFSGQKGPKYWEHWNTHLKANTYGGTHHVPNTVLSISPHSNPILQMRKWRLISERLNDMWYSLHPGYFFLVLEALEALGQGSFWPSFQHLCPWELSLGKQKRFDFLKAKAHMLELSYPNLNLRAQVTGQWPKNIFPRLFFNIISS